MTVPIDETIAWQLVSAVPAGLSQTDRPTRFHHSPTPEIWLHVEPTGRWEASGPLTPEGRDVLDIFVPLQVAADLVVGQIGQSLDGRIATETGQSHYVTGPADIRRLHRLRALADAVVVGAGTVSSDDPRLTVREVEGRDPVRVILDPSGRLDDARRVFDGEAPTLVVRARPDGVDEIADDEVEGPAPSPDATGVEIVWLRLDGGERTFRPQAVLAALRDRGLRRVLVEGGGLTVSRFLHAGALDRLHVTVAPLIMGSGLPAITLPPIESLGEAIRPTCRWFRLGDDVLCDLELR